MTGLVLTITGWLTLAAGSMRRSSSSAQVQPPVPLSDLLSGIPTPGHAEEVRLVVAERYSESSKSSISSALVIWDQVVRTWGWERIIRTGDPIRGGKLATFVLALMAHTPFFPSSTISNYVWALCAFMQQELHMDPRFNVVGWSFFMAAVKVLTYVPYEPRTRLPTSAIRSALSAVDTSDFVAVQTALLVLFLYFTFQRSEFPCPKTYGGLDSRKHCLVRHMEPWQRGTRWAVGTTKADPRAERLSGDAGPGREWIIIGEVNDELFDMRYWLQFFCGFFPPGPRDPESAFFLAADRKRPLIYQSALSDLRVFLQGHVDDPSAYGLHSVRSEGYMTCAGAVSHEAAVIQGGWKNLRSASRYDRLTLPVANSMASKMVSFHSTSSSAGSHSAEFRDDSSLSSDDSVDPYILPPSSSSGLSSGRGLGIAAARATTRVSGASGSSSVHPKAARRPAPKPLPVGSSGSSHPTPPSAESSVSSSSAAGDLPAGWSRRRRKGTGGKFYSIFCGPDGVQARSAAQAWARVAELTSAHSSSHPVAVDNLVDHTTFHDRPSGRRPPVPRQPSS